MVLANPKPIRVEKIREMELPVIDLSGQRSEVSKLIGKACEEFGFFKVINHGVDMDIIRSLEDESLAFFGKPVLEKQQVVGLPTKPYGYGSKNIGFNGDIGEVEYLLININPTSSISQISKTISTLNPNKFRYYSNILYY